MSTSTAKMLRDAAGNLIPQYYDQTSDAFVPGVGNSSVRQIGSDVAFPQAWLLPWSIVSSLGTPLALPSDLTNYAMGFVTFSGLGTDGKEAAHPIRVSISGSIFLLKFAMESSYS